MILSLDLATALWSQYRRERTNALVYRSLAYHADLAAFDATARAFLSDSAEEEEHAQRILIHLTQRNVPLSGILPLPFDVTIPPFTRETPLASYYQAALALEEQNTAALTTGTTIAQDAHDWPVFALLNDLLSLQVPSEYELDTAITQLSGLTRAEAVLWDSTHA